MTIKIQSSTGRVLFLEEVKERGLEEVEERGLEGLARRRRGFGDGSRLSSPPIDLKLVVVFTMSIKVSFNQMAIQ